MLKTLCVAVAMVAFCFDGAPSHAASEYKIVTASKRGTYIQIGRDLAKSWSRRRPASISKCWSRRARPRTCIACASSRASSWRSCSPTSTRPSSTRRKPASADAGNIIRPLRLILPLYDEEIYFVARADSPLNYIHEIRDKKHQRRPARQRHGAHHENALPADVRRADAGRPTRST